MFGFILLLLKMVVWPVRDCGRFPINLHRLFTSYKPSHTSETLILLYRVLSPVVLCFLSFLINLLYRFCPPCVRTATLIDKLWFVCRLFVRLGNVCDCEGADFIIGSLYILFQVRLPGTPDYYLDAL
jgi:hypothetical protein